MHVDVFPMGIDFEKYSTAAQDHDVRQDIERIRNRMRGHKTIFTVSRLDYTKGLPESLEAVREFFERYPDWHEEVVFVLVVVPSRENVATYAALKREINEMVGRLNSEYGNLDWTPIRYVYRSLRFGELVGLYCVANVALITPLRDGMNLIAKEYLAARSDETGVLIISEMAGASKELVEAIIVNPSSKEEIADAIHRALTMPVEEQRRRNALMRRRLAAQDVHQWVKRFFKRLQEAVEASQLLAVRMLDSASVETIRRAYREAHRRLFVLDYDGTLVPFADEPSMAKPDAELMAMLTKLQHIPANDVIVLSGRDRQTLEEWLAGTGVTLVAEHGAWRWSPQDRRWDLLLGGPDSEWKKEIRPIVQLFVDRIPGSFIEEKQYSLVWHYRKAESETATIAARELLDTVVNMATNLPIHVLPGNKTVEVRSFGVSKGIFFKRIVEAGLPEFIVAAGDDWTDEDLFAVLPDSAISIKVGLRISKARYNVKSYHDVRALLQSLEG
jgi:trehalose 6-phosphate synthase/phosphatase